VDPGSGRMDLTALFPEWRAGRDFAAFALPHIQRAFLRREYFSSSSRPAQNPEAQELFLKDPAAFADRARACASTTLHKVYENDP
ncbi:unnamed protein product, partial [Polarella glacialis]